MIRVEMKAKGQRLLIFRGKIVEGDMQFAATVKQLARKLIKDIKAEELDYCIAQELVAIYGGRIEKISLK